MFCCRVRYYSWQSTVKLVGEYGKACRRVRYSLWRSTVRLAGEYGIVARRAKPSKIAVFAGIFCLNDSFGSQTDP
jgi:hypothetical protein